ncbi:MAG: hypothetical protein NTV39_03660 [Candidatus Saccharibacteria bacterium]|nr:hypothetical protein [Candidatus Saccharibacteria bacterium]
MLSDKKIIENLNLTGNFLEASMFSEIANHDHYIATAEWPFSTSNFNGTADIIALNHHVQFEEPLVFFIIECKKANKDHKVWVFDRCSGNRDITHPFLRFAPNGSRVYTDRTGYLLPLMGINRVEDAPLYNKGYELRETDGNLNRNDSERIHKALTQANRAFVALAETDVTKIFKVSKATFEVREILFVPLVITNATIKVLNYSSEKIDKNKGEIDVEHITTEERDFILYDFPLSSELQVSGNHNSEVIYPYKRPTFIVRADKAIELMQAISSAAEY